MKLYILPVRRYTCLYFEHLIEHSDSPTTYSAASRTHDFSLGQEVTKARDYLNLRPCAESHWEKWAQRRMTIKETDFQARKSVELMDTYWFHWFRFRRRKYWHFNPIIRDDNAHTSDTRRWGRLSRKTPQVSFNYADEILLIDVCPHNWFRCRYLLHSFGSLLHAHPPS